MHYSRHHLTA